MPGIFRVACDSCDFERTASASVMLVELADGGEEICPHPMERRIAEEKTGEPWRQLVSSGRVRYRYSAMCGNCGELDYYEAAQRRRRGHIWSIVRQPTGGDLAVPCANCGQDELHLIAERRLRNVICPGCGAGHLRSDLVARS
jgi:hypothetical protein